MSNTNNLYKDKPFIEIYEYLPVAIMPICTFQISLMIYSQLMLLEGTALLFISIILYLTSDELNVFRSVKEFRSRTLIFYMVTGVFAFMVGLFELLPLMVFFVLASVIWAFYVYKIYKIIYNSENKSIG